MTIRPVGAELFHADLRTDMTKLIVDFHNFWNALKMYDLKLELVSSHNYAFKTKLIRVLENLMSSWHTT